MKDSRKVHPKSAAGPKKKIGQFPKANGSSSVQKRANPSPLKPKPSKIPQFGKSAGYLGHSFDKAADPSRARKSKTIPQYGQGGKNMTGSRGTDR